MKTLPILSSLLRSQLLRSKRANSPLFLPDPAPIQRFISGLTRPDGTRFCETQPTFPSALAVRVLDGEATLMVSQTDGSYLPLRNYCSLAPSWELYLCKLVIFEAARDGEMRDGFYFPVTTGTAALLDCHFPNHLLSAWKSCDPGAAHLLESMA